MRIIHLMLSSFYIDNSNYQENCLPRQNKIDGHDVTIIASTEVFINGKNSTKFIEPSSYINEDCIPVHRLPLINFLSRRISKKIKKFKGLSKYLNLIQPDIIFFHGISSFDLITVSFYCSLNKLVKLYVDCHSDYNNSAKSFISKYFLHKIIYKFFISLSYKNIFKIYYITSETKLFLNEVYGLSDEKLDYLPLGGFVIGDSERSFLRSKIRTSLNIPENKLVFLHSGKMDINKRTYEIISAFKHFDTSQFVFLLAGSMEEEVEKMCKPLINENSSIINLGWISGSRLQELLYATDIYLQLGSQSVTMQNALCSGCAVALFPYPSHTFLLKEIPYYIENTSDIVKLVHELLNNRELLEIKKMQSLDFAKQILDYKVIANQYLNKNL